MRLLLLTILIFSAEFLQAQKVKGKVTTATGDILPYASISVKGTSKGTTTNSQGQYSLNLSPGTHTLIDFRLHKSARYRKNMNEPSFIFL